MKNMYETILCKFTRIADIKISILDMACCNLNYIMIKCFT